jgi:hypothetical protein
VKRGTLFGASLGVLAMATSTGAQAADIQANCISEEEIAAIVIYVMPPMIAAAQTSCKTRLASDGFIATSGTAMAQRYSERADAVWPLAKSAFVKFGGGSKDKDMRELVKLPDATMRPLIDAMLQQKVAEEIQPKSCHDIERLAKVVNQIEPDTTGALIGVIAAMAIGDKDKPKVCEDASS